ncbi:hypothetical protein ACFQ5J_08145 [Lacticaseibacillus baoqingensis]|uniref:DUF1642 domain-containing protein n=1 Tax=Lacticaseibacillus baoqingensis TaxID=2486013 RepID=A0ABW4E892_9LACO|nr:hypothetical protein [Lacticaseibacillus baoqingensis]
MPELVINQHHYPDLTIPTGYQLVVDKRVFRNGQPVHLRRYQPAELPQEALNREHVTVISGEDDALISYNALTSPLSGPLPKEKEAFAAAERIWQQVAPQYRKQLSPLRLLTGLTRTYVNAAGQTVTVPVEWAKYMNTVVAGSYEWVGFGPTGQIIEFERQNLWDFDTDRQETEMWNGDDWILAHRGLGPQLPAPWPVA